MTKQDVVTVDTTIVVCEGTPDADGHPRVFLRINPDIGEVACSYCSRIFRLETDTQDKQH